MKVGDLVKLADDLRTLSAAQRESYGLGLILEQTQKGSSTVLWQKDHLVMTTWDGWLEVINENR